MPMQRRAPIQPNATHPSLPPTPHPRYPPVMPAPAPLVSVLIPTHNRAHYVLDAVASALAQTLTDTEIIVVDDGSTDATAQALATVTDPRLRIVRHATNQGIPATRNTALAAARGRYVAWLDSDDIARPTRLAEQVAFLESHPDIAMVGAAAGKLRPDGTRKPGIRVPPLAPELIAAWLLFRSAFQQSSVTGRAAILTAHRYDPAFPVSEDLDMFLRLQRDHRLANLPRVLIDRRLHPEQSVRQHQHAILSRKMALSRPLLDRLGLNPDNDDLRRHALLGKADLSGMDVDADFLDWTRDWLRRLTAANRTARLFDPPSLAMASAYVHTIACRALAPRIGTAAALRHLLSAPPLALASPVTLGWIARALPAYLGR